MSNRAYISWGSNLGEQVFIVKSALKNLQVHPDVSVLRISPWYRSKAVGPGSQHDYLNGVALLSTTLSAPKLLDLLQAIELDHGRERIIRWGARTLDLDILLFNDERYNTNRLQIPHPRMLERNFVMKPLLSIYDQSHLLGIKTEDILREVTDSDLTLWQD